MKTYGLIGYPLTHSFSKKYFTEKFENERIVDCKYELFSIEQAQDLLQILENDSSICGINVTIPHKVNVLSMLNEVDPVAAEIGAVNTINIKKVNGKNYLKGYNTDAHGFEESLKPLLKANHKKALIFGDGGAAKAVKYVLNKLGIAYQSVVRSPQAGKILYSDVTPEILSTHTLLINTTPLGTFPNVDAQPPIDYSILSDAHLAYDLVYNPLATAFLRKAAQQGATTINGLQMLHLQAEKAWFIWNS
ncbi:shikimate dehydrogenase [Pedobacter changchengzhani]|uniref:Shikimate dehydrogenase n=1 Tax=Pedobacter changchengzhani TaxID=2529274 RepID=A0A4R5MQG1_9SPHI|nr:shikimate dehydrogenase [Pedobacter changchengzhani]TDG37625.1 shikimate dehydrogenase [Pedobacter changchengzhani]